MSDCPFTYDALMKWQKGDRVTTEGVMPGVSSEPLTWEVEEVDRKRLVAFFKTYYFGIFFGDFKVTVKKGGRPTIAALADIK